MEYSVAHDLLIYKGNRPLILHNRLRRMTVMRYFLFQMLLVGVAIANLNCGSQQSQNSLATINSRYLPPWQSDPQQGTQPQWLDDCNSFESSEWSGRIKTYENAFGQISDNTAAIKILRIPSAFSTGAATSLKFFRLKATADNKLERNETPPVFHIEDLYTRNAISGTLSDLAAADIKTISNNFYYQDLTPDQFFQKVQIVLPGIDIQYTALELVHYSNGQATAWARFLIPPFSVNPNTYATTHPRVLLEMHPFYSVMGNGMSDAEYFNLSRQYCF